MTLPLSNCLWDQLRSPLGMPFSDLLEATGSVLVLVRRLENYGAILRGLSRTRSKVTLVEAICREQAVTGPGCKFFKKYKRIRLNWAAFTLACPGLADGGDKCNSETVLQVGGSSNVEWTSDGSQKNIARSC